MRFCQMLLNGGELDGVRILSPTVKLMASNSSPQGHPAMGPAPASVSTSPSCTTRSRRAPTLGEYYGGAAGTWFWIDPVEDLVFVGMIQQFGDSVPICARCRRLTYQAILKPGSMQ